MPLRSARRGWVAAFAAMLLMIAAPPVFSQSPPPAQGQPAQVPPGQFVPPAPPPAAPGAPQSSVQEAPAPEAPPKPGNVFEAIGRWWDKSASDFKQSVEENNAKWRQGVEENNARWRDLNAKNEKAAKDAAAASREAVEAFKNLSSIRMVEGRQVCEISSNGSPDCQTAADVFCKSKGFTTGKSADITTTRKCTLRSIRDGAECKVETVMIKAACQ